MKEIDGLFIILMLLATAIISFIVYAIIRKKVRLTFLGVGVLIFFLLFKPRTGGEIYKALFNGQKAECVELIDYADQNIPIIDFAIFLHFKTCPEEMKRVLSLHPFKSYKIYSEDSEDVVFWATEKWFRPEVLGDSLLQFTYEIDEYGNGQTIYTNLDSTEAYCADFWD